MICQTAINKEINYKVLFQDWREGLQISQLY
jgi:hypothetical protein